jgi:hypothetical protein
MQALSVVRPSNSGSIPASIGDFRGLRLDRPMYLAELRCSISVRPLDIGVPVLAWRERPSKSVTGRAWL